MQETNLCVPAPAFPYLEIDKLSVCEFLNMITKILNARQEREEKKTISRYNNLIQICYYIRSQYDQAH